MCVGEVADVDIVANAGTVGGGEIGAIDVNMIALVGCRLNRDFNKMGGPSG